MKSIKVLKALVRVMREVEKSALRINMGTFITENDFFDLKEMDDLHNCGTAACVCGYAGFDKEVRELLNINISAYEFQGGEDCEEINGKIDASEVGHKVWDSVSGCLVDNGLERLEADEITNSMFGPSSGCRRESFCYVTSTDSVSDIPHLTGRSSPKAAADFIEQHIIPFVEKELGVAA